MRTHYDTLNLPKHASIIEVKRAYRRLSKKLHPDMNPDPEAHEQFIKVQEAYELLSDPARKHAYDVKIDKITPEELVHKLILKMKL
jgi:DnaJ-class molecular chaperone